MKCKLKKDLLIAKSGDIVNCTVLNEIRLENDLICLHVIFEKDGCLHSEYILKNDFDNWVTDAEGRSVQVEQCGENHVSLCVSCTNLFKNYKNEFVCPWWGQDGFNAETVTSCGFYSKIQIK